MDAASSHAAHLAHAHSQSAWRHRDSCQCCCLSARRTSPTLPASHHGLSRNLSAFATMRVAIAQLSGAARESEPALKNHAICSDPDRTGLRGLQPVWCIDDKANSWPLCLLSLLFFLIDAENFDRSMDRTPCTLFCASVTVNMLLRVTHNTSLTADDFLIAFIVSRLLPGSAESCHCDCTLVFALVTAGQGG